MLECRVTETVFQTRPVFHGPSVYLEQWAYAMFSRQPEQRQAFVEALAERGGTLALGRRRAQRVGATPSAVTWT
jgi:hypothetical protein